MLASDGESGNLSGILGRVKEEWSEPFVLLDRLDDRDPASPFGDGSPVTIRPIKEEVSETF